MSLEKLCLVAFVPLNIKVITQGQLDVYCLQPEKTMKIPANSIVCLGTGSVSP